MEHCMKPGIVLIMIWFGAVIDCRHTDGHVETYCTQTARHRMDSSPRKIIPQLSNVSGLSGTTPWYDAASMKLSMCPDSRFLKISWIMNQTQEADVNLCYKMRSRKNETIVDTVCYSLYVHKSDYHSAMDCWFRMEFTDKRPTVISWVGATDRNVGTSSFGSLDTSALDIARSCEDICEVTMMLIATRIGCRDMASLGYDTGAVVKHLSFEAINNNTSCEGIAISKQTETRLEYRLNCAFDGLGHIKVLYSIRGQYCLKYQMIKVMCSNGNTIEQAAAIKLKEAHSFATFLLFGAVCIAVITAMVFITVFVVQWLMRVRTSYKQSHQDRDKEERDGYPLKLNNSQSIGDTAARQDDSAVYTPVANVTRNTQGKRIYSTSPIQPQKQIDSTPLWSPPRKRFDSTSSNILRKPSRKRFGSTSSDDLPKNVNVAQGMNIGKLRKCVTMALLEDTDPFYKRKILFLPTPFDHYSRDVAELLKNVFTGEAGIVSECCFERKIFQEYVTGDRKKWIETLLGDHNKILIFLCFTSFCLESKHDSVVTDVLDRLLITRGKSHRMCKVVLIHLTDSPDSMQQNHHGDSFHINNTESYSRFIGNVLSYCGKIPDDNPDIVHTLSTCKASEHFLRLIGIQSVG